MKRCPSCHRVYEDDAMSFCLEDGTPLESASESSFDPGATVKIPEARLTHQAPTEVMPGGVPGTTQHASSHPRHDASAPPAPAERKSNALPWILGAALVLGLSAIAVALIMTRGSGTDNSQVAQNTAQPENTAPSENTSPATEPSAVATSNMAVTPVSSAPTPASNATSKTQTTRTPEQPSATPKPTSTPKPAPETTPTPPPRRSAPVSGGVLNGKAISLPKPAYPAIAKAARASGTVTVQVTVDESGRVISARAVGGHPLLQQSAVQAAYQARFSPTLLSGQPVKMTGVVTYNFTLQ